MAWDLEDVEVGDFLSVETANKQGDRNLDGCVFSGTVVEINPKYNQAKLDTGWCVHPKDILREHRKKATDGQRTVQANNSTTLSE